MVQHEQLAHALVAHAVLTWQDERVGEELLADGADQLPLDVLDRHLSTGRRGINKSPPIENDTFTCHQQLCYFEEQPIPALVF